MSLRPGLYLRHLRDLPHDLRWARRHGAVWAELRFRTLDQVYERGRYAVVEQDLERLVDHPPPAGVSIELAGSDPSALAEIAPRRALASIGRDGARCVVAWSEGRAVGYECWSPGLDPGLDLLPVPLPPGTAFGHDLFVAPAARGRGVGSALAAGRLVDVRDHGFRRLRRLIAPGNTASWRTVERSAPARVVGEVWFVKTPGRLRTGFEPAQVAESADPS